jgi:hypothetical protein
MKWIQVQIEDDFYLEIKTFSVKEDIQMNSLLLMAIKNYISQIKERRKIEEVVTETLSSLEERNLSKEDSNE